jgi:hypothetical protein
MKYFIFLTIFSLVCICRAGEYEKTVKFKDVVYRSLVTYPSIKTEEDYPWPLFILEKEFIPTGKKKILWMDKIETPVYVGNPEYCEKMKRRVCQIAFSSACPYAYLFGEKKDFLILDKGIYIVSVRWYAFNAFYFKNMGITVKISKIPQEETTYNENNVINLYQKLEANMIKNFGRHYTSSIELPQNNHGKPNEKEIAKLKNERNKIIAELNKYLHIVCSKKYSLKKPIKKAQCIFMATSDLIKIYPKSLKLELKDDKILVYVNTDRPEKTKKKKPAYLSDAFPEWDEVKPYLITYDIKADTLSELKFLSDKNRRNENEKEKPRELSSESAPEKTFTEFFSGKAGTGKLYRLLNGVEDESVRRSDIAVILLSRLGVDIVKKDFDFSGFRRMYSDCVEHLASLPEMTLSADTISEWRRKGNLRETEAEIYDFIRGDRYLLPETMLSMAFGLRKLYVEEMMKAGSEKAKEKAGGFIRERLSEVLKISGASPMKKLLEDLKAGGPFDNSAKELCARLLAPVKPLKYEKVENKTKQIDGVPASWLYVSPFKTPKELAERVACLKKIDEQQEASNYAFMLLFALKDKIEWICDGKMSMDGYINTADTLISKINPEKPLTTGLKKHWHPYFKRIRRKAYRDFITAALIPVYFRMKILATLHEKTADGQNRKDSEEIAKFIRRESGNIIKSIPAPPITAMCWMVSQNPFISDEELYPKLK